MITIFDEWVVPHIIKIPEALTALVDKRYEVDDGKTIRVFSSDYTKKYTVTIFSDGYASNDNMSYNNGVLGYPIVVALFLEKKIDIDWEIANLFSGVNWTATNLRFNKDFMQSMQSVIREKSNQMYTYDTIMSSIIETYECLLRVIPTFKRYKSDVSFEDSIIC